MESIASNPMRIAFTLLSALLAAGAVWLATWGFQKILDFRMLERIPLTSISAAIPGEVHVKGTAQTIRTIKTPYTGSEVIYYRYLLEREERDSEGNRTWRTLRDESDAVDFRLTDASGEALVKLPQRSRAEVNVLQRHQSRQGNVRHTEWHLRQGDELSLFAWMEADENPTFSFEKQGNYLPIVSAQGSALERRSLSHSALFLLWAGITCLIFACFTLMVVLRVHRTLAFLTTVSSACLIFLLNLGWNSVETDVDAGYSQVESYLTRSAEQDQSSTATEQSKDERQATRYLMIQRFDRHIADFPESWVFSLSGYAPFPKIPLNGTQANIAREKAAQFSQTQATQSYILMPIGFVLAAVFAWFAMGIIRIKRVQENIPTSKTAGVSYGLAEVVGILDNEDEAKLFRGPVSGALCCWYRELVQERRGSGKNAKWITIKDEIRKQPFVVEDDDGEIRVFPGQADIITKHTESQRSGRFRYTEWRLSPGDELYVLGKARLDKTRGDTLVFGHESGSPYIIANVPEAEVMLRKATKGMGLLSIGMSLLFFVCIWLSGSSGSFSSVDFLLSAGLAPIFLILVMVVLMYNDLVFLKERCERNWANIQVSLKKRADLIPQLESVVKEYLSHESNLQSDLALLRERSRNISSGGDMDAYMAAEHVFIAELQARIEQYSDLQGSRLIQDFHKRLVKLENEVALIREGFNDAVT
jgi:hypothetical protein